MPNKTKNSNGVFKITPKMKDGYLTKVENLQDKRVAIVVHKIPDADALASAFAVQYDLGLRGIDADIFGSEGLSHPQNKTLVNRLRIDNIKDKSFFDENSESYGLIIFCDTNESNASLIGVYPHIVLDHHLTEKIATEALDIRGKVGSTSTIVYLLLEKLERELTPEVATALAIGIGADTKDLTKEDETTEIDIQVHKKLLSQIDYPLFANISYRYEIPHQLIELMGKGFYDIVFDGCVAVVGVGGITTGQKDHCAFIADLVFRVPETRLVVVIGIENGECIRSSVRTNLDLIQIGEFCKIVFEADSVTDTGRASVGARIGSGGALVPLSHREREEWAVASEEEKQVLFKIKMRRYGQRIQKILDS